MQPYILITVARYGIIAELTSKTGSKNIKIGSAASRVVDGATYDVRSADLLRNLKNSARSASIIKEPHIGMASTRGENC